MTLVTKRQGRTVQDEETSPASRPARGDSEFLDALANGLNLLELFGRDRTRITINEAAEALGITRAGARRILLTLASLGFLAQDERHFTLTSRVLDLGYRFYVSNGVAGIAQPIMRKLCEEVGESVYLNVLEGADTVVIARIEADTLLRLHLPEGTRMPAFVHSGGRTLLAERSDREIGLMLEALALEQLTPATLTRAEDLLAALERIRHEGYAIADGEIEEGLSGLAVPIRNRSGAAVAALSFCLVNRGRTAEDIRTTLLGPLQEAAHEISHLLGRTPLG